ncbi:MAG TPA: hypothetical protein VGH49_02665 [Xanthobacteraceae bacterium]|jgi:hypothetical protein
MCHIASSLVGGLAAVAAWALVAPPSNDPAANVSGASPMQINTQVMAVNRAAKADRLDVSRASGGHDGRVLFQSDPKANVTVISKGFVLPQPPIRQTQKTNTVPARAPSEQQTPVPIGCEPLASPISQPQLARLTGRCVVQNEIGFERAVRNG